MAYSNGQNNVFIDLSDAGKNAAVTDSLGASTATTTIAVGYLTQGSNGAAVRPRPTSAWARAPTMPTPRKA